MSDTRERNEREQFHPDDSLFADPPTFDSSKSDVSLNVDAYVADAVSDEHDD